MFLALYQLLKLLVPSIGNNCRAVKPDNWSRLCEFVGADFDYRIVNKFGDFVGIVKHTLQLSIRKRRSIRKFTNNLEAVTVDRGHQLTIRFVTFEGNRAAFKVAYGSDEL